MVASAWRRIALFASVGVLLLSVLVQPAAAQEGGSGLIISPTRNPLEVAAGSSDRFTVNLRNVSGADVRVRAVINDFKSDGESGEPKIITDPDYVDPFSIKKFITNVSDVTLKKDERKDIDITVDVPAGTVAGAYYGVIRYTAVPGGEQTPGEGTIAMNASVGTLVLITVPGQITEQIQVRSIRARLDKKPSSFFFKSPTDIATEIKNNGNGFSQPFGRISVSRGNTEVWSDELNNADERANILPKSVRTFDNALENINRPGRYTITASISHGSGGEVIPFKTSFWYIPLWILIAIGVALLVILIAGYILYRRKFQKKKSKTQRFGKKR